MSNFGVSSDQPPYILLKKFLLMDPKKRITTNEAIEDVYMREKPLPVRDAFSCYKSKIPFPIRPFLPKKADPAEGTSKLQHPPPPGIQLPFASKSISVPARQISTKKTRADR